jgi:hypothetical protein
MLTSRIFSQEWEVEPKLKEFGGVTIAELLQIVDKVVGARAEATDNDPLGAGGQFAYIYGTRHVRGVWKSKGWTSYREENVESVRDLKTLKQIVYQSVDVAGAKQSPLALRGKGPGARRLIDSAQGLLFPDELLPEAAPKLVEEAPVLIWYFCVSVTTTEAGEMLVGAELSLPMPIKGDNFCGFIERIIIRPNGPWNRSVIVDSGSSDDAVEFEPKISRK